MPEHRSIDKPSAARPEPAQVRCRRCLELSDSLDGLLWCNDCRARERRVAAWWGRITAMVGAVALILWIHFEIAPSNRFLLFWAAAVIVGYRLAGRLVQELAYGVLRVRNRAGARALPAAPGGQRDSTN